MVSYRVEQLKTQTTDAEARATDAEARATDAEARATDAVEQLKTQATDAEARATDAEARAVKTEARAVKAETEVKVLNSWFEGMKSVGLNNPTPDADGQALEVRQLALRCAHSYSSPAHPWIATDNIAVPRPRST